MAINIKITNSEISGNSRVLNNLRPQEGSEANIHVSDSSVTDYSQLLNDIRLAGKSAANIGVENSEFLDHAKILNDVKVQNEKINVDLKNLSLGQDVEFMNGRNFTGKTSDHNQTSTKTNGSQDVEFMNGEKFSEKTSDHNPSTKTSRKKDGFLKRFIKSIFQRNSEEKPSEEMYSSKDNKSFQNKVSMDGQLRNLDTSDAIHTYEQTDVKTKTEQNEHDCRD